MQDGREGGRGYRDGDMRGPRDDRDRGGFRVSADSCQLIGVGGGSVNSCQSIGVGRGGSCPCGGSDRRPIQLLANSNMPVSIYILT